MENPRPVAFVQNEIALSDRDFARLAARAYDDFGIHLPAAKKELLYSRLIKRLRSLDLPDFGSYCSLLESREGQAEQTEFLTALTTNVTHFFREGHHFKLLRDSVLPPLLQAARKGGKVRLWSSACSAGQEAYSLAFSILDLCPEVARLNVRILATDIDPAILARASSGVYPMSELKSIPVANHKYLEIDRRDGETFSIGVKARDLIRIGALNLIKEWPVRGPFDVIFCRNVAIYFDKPTQARLWSRFANLLNEGGHLMIGHSERVAGGAEAILQTVGITAYKKIRPQSRSASDNEQVGSAPGES